MSVCWVQGSHLEGNRSSGQATGEPREANFFCQDLATAIQRDNARSIFSQPVWRGFTGSGESSST